MPPPPTITPAKRRTRRKRTSAPSSVAPAALTLVSASYDDTIPRLTLAFDRPIGIGAYNGAAIIVNDGAINGLQYDGQGGISLIDPAIVEIELVEVGPWSGPDVRLNATPISGIVAAGDGAAWAGVTNLLLPFP